MPAETTNALTNALHALCLLLYFLGAVRNRRLGYAQFSLAFTAFFLILFVLKVMGVYVHYKPQAEAVPTVWAAIALVLIVLNYVVLQAVSAPFPFRASVLMLAIGFTILAAWDGTDFTYLALPIAITAIAAAYYSRSLLRAGFIAVLASNVFWILARKATEGILDGEVPEPYRYDNDVYHIFLIISTFMIYKGVLIKESDVSGEAFVPGSSSSSVVPVPSGGKKD